MGYNLRMESYEKTLRKHESCDLSFFKPELLLECAFMFLLSVADTSELLKQLAMYLYRKTCFCHVQLVLVIEHLIHVILLNPQTINCLML